MLTRRKEYEEKNFIWLIELLSTKVLSRRNNLKNFVMFKSNTYKIGPIAIPITLRPITFVSRLRLSPTLVYKLKKSIINIININELITKIKKYVKSLGTEFSLISDHSRKR